MQSTIANPDSLSLTNVLLLEGGSGGQRSVVGNKEQERKPRVGGQKTQLLVPVLPNWSKQAVALGLSVLISDLGPQHLPCILPRVAGRMRGSEDKGVMGLRRAKFRVGSQGRATQT